MRDRIVKYTDLRPSVQEDVKRRYVHWHHDTTVKTFEEWARKHSFYVTKSGKLSNRHNHCEPDYMAD